MHTSGIESAVFYGLQRSRKADAVETGAETESVEGDCLYSIGEDDGTKAVCFAEKALWHLAYVGRHNYCSQRTATIKEVVDKLMESYEVDE